HSLSTFLNKQKLVCFLSLPYINCYSLHYFAINIGIFEKSKPSNAQGKCGFQRKKDTIEIEYLLIFIKEL
ncbi:MAG: hypothetical protein PHF26_01900, partial [Candidatus Gracilibacteria bacterium]|nr:hypothetical protein [Candidatus Gracilibacteria bacterium]